LNTSTGVISGTPDTLGAASFTVRVDSDDEQFTESEQSVTTSAMANSWDAATATVSATFDESEQRLLADAASTGTYANARSERALSGLCYFSGVVASPSGELAGFGVVQGSVDVSSAAFWVGSFAGGVGAWASLGNVYRNNTAGGAVASGTEIAVEFAVRVSERKVWIRASGGAWVGGGDPAANTSPTWTLSGSDDLYACGTIERAGATSARYVRLHGTSGATTGTPPSGFTAASWA
jgi:hypothetical protein